MADGMFEPLTPAECDTVMEARPGREPWTPIIPVPDDALPAPCAHPQLGEPVARWTYRDTQGHVLGHIARFDTADGKEFRPITYGDNKAGQRAWQWRSWDTPRPLYGLDRLAARPDAPVLVVEGEKSADAAQQHFPDLIAITWPGGADAAHLGDWSFLQGREILIWPDNDEPGRRAAQEVARQCEATGAASVFIVDVPRDWPAGWDLADPSPDGVTSNDLRARFDTIDPPGDPRFERCDDGLWYVDTKEPIRLCGPFHIVAEVRDPETGNGQGLVLHWSDNEGRRHELILQKAELLSEGGEYRKHLVDGGLYVSPNRGAREKLAEYLLLAKSRKRARFVSRVGWHETPAGPEFILPDRAFGAAGNDRVFIRIDETPAFNVAGTLEGWQQNIARHAIGNARLAFAISAAFAAPLLHLVGAESGGFHFRGRSSIGKTLLIEAAGSVWGGGLKSYIKTWRSTDNGLEATAATHNDCLLCLDEIGQADAKTVASTAYMLANGAGKQRAKRVGTSRESVAWRLLFLSTGELSLAAKVEEDGRRRVAAGQQVRVVDVPADAGKGLGVFEDIHGEDSSARFANKLKNATKIFYGAPARAFLERITDKPLDEVAAAVRGFRDDFVNVYCPPLADGQVQRVAERFGLVAAGGELAIALGILPWESGEATRAASACFKAWLDARGGHGAAEEAAMLAQVRRFIEQHGESRFTPMGEYAEAQAERPTINRAGFRRKVDGGAFEYFVLPEVWRTEICQGLDSREVARVLKEHGMLIPSSQGKLQSTHRLPGLGPKRCYRLSPAVLGDGAGNG